MAVWKPRCSANGLDLGLELGLGGVRVGELSGDEEFRGDWRGDCWARLGVAGHG